MDTKQKTETEQAQVNLDTGEIRRHIFEGEKVIIRENKAQYEEFYYFNPHEEFIKQWDSVIPEIISVRLSGAEMAILLFLSAHIEYDSFIIRKNGRQQNSFDIQNSLSLSPATIKKALKTQRDKGFISVSRTAKAYTYVANPYVFAKGKRCNSTLVGLFERTPQYKKLVNSSCRKQEKIEADNLYFAEDATFIRMWKKVMPYIVNTKLTGAELIILLICFRFARYESGLIAYSNGIPLPEEKMSDICGLSARTIKDGIQKLIEIGFISRDENRIYLNPFIASKGNRIDSRLYLSFKDTEAYQAFDKVREDIEEWV